MNIAEIKTYIESHFTEDEDDLKAKFAEVVAFVTGKEQAIAEKAAALAVDIQNATALLRAQGYTIVFSGEL